MFKGESTEIEPSKFIPKFDKNTNPVDDHYNLFKKYSDDVHNLSK